MKIGSVVNKKTGGYLMTIENINEDIVDCIWFSDGQLCSDTFQIHDLQEWVKP